jgi:hypothetical protein
MPKTDHTSVFRQWMPCFMTHCEKIIKLKTGLLVLSWPFSGGGSFNATFCEIDLLAASGADMGLVKLI